MNNTLLKKQPEAMTIGEMAATYGVSLRTLRFYEDKGLLTPTRAGTARFYSPKDAIRLQLVQMGKKLGFSLSEIDRLIRSHIALKQVPPARLQEVLDEKLVAAQLVRLKHQRDLLDEAIADLEDQIGSNSLNSAKTA